MGHKFRAGAAGYSGSSQVSRRIPAACAWASSLAAALIGWRVWMACATAAGRRWDSSSVSDALKMASGLPNARRSFPAMRAPRPGVKARASHPRYWSGAIEVAASVRGYCRMCQVMKMLRIDATRLTCFYGCAVRTLRRYRPARSAEGRLSENSPAAFCQIEARHRRENFNSGRLGFCDNLIGVNRKKPEVGKCVLDDGAVFSVIGVGDGGPRQPKYDVF